MNYNPYFIFFLTLLISIIAHEFGHWIYIKRQTGLSMQPKFIFKGLKTCIEMQFPKHLSNHQKLNCALFGICFGLAPILLIILSSTWHYYIFLLPIYMAGCNYDIIQMVKIIKKENEEVFKSGE